MNKQAILVIFVLIQLALSNLLGPKYIFPKIKQKKDVTTILSAVPQNENLSKEQLNKTLQNKKQQSSNLKKQESRRNQTFQPEQKTNKYNSRLLAASINLTDSNSKSIPTMISQSTSSSNIPEVKTALTLQVLDYFYTPLQIRDRSKIYASIIKETYYSINLDMIVVGSRTIDPNTKINAVIQGNQNATSINVIPGVPSKQVVPFYGVLGMNEISVFLKVDGKCPEFIYGLLYNIEVVQVK